MVSPDIYKFNYCLMKAIIEKYKQKLFAGKISKVWLVRYFLLIFIFTFKHLQVIS